MELCEAILTAYLSVAGGFLSDWDLHYLPHCIRLIPLSLACAFSRITWRAMCISAAIDLGTTCNGPWCSSDYRSGGAAVQRPGATGCAAEAAAKSKPLRWRVLP